MKIAVLGAGAWGTALAISAARAATSRSSAPRHQVSLWARDAAQLADMQSQRVNARYLPDMALPPSLMLAGGPDASLDALLTGQDLIVIATPIAGLRGMLQRVQAVRAPVAWLCKGFEAPLAGGGANLKPFGLLAHEIRAQAAINLRAGALSGPSFAQEVARGQPTALVAASEHAEVREALVAAFHGPALRVYANDDIVGVEVGGAVKNVLAIATGLCD
ncbi:MAG: NAD(P)H-dependent glycerol-3-phosphate dehydrogenase, partial [Pseudomonadota bacterium]|nr:NAD(P)H-dependent glycerol-3-phosphate dehydrogenase [Pseudomonadota bacterium]